MFQTTKTRQEYEQDTTMRLTTRSKPARPQDILPPSAKPEGFFSWKKRGETSLPESSPKSVADKVITNVITGATKDANWRSGSSKILTPNFGPLAADLVGMIAI